jgi:hypothetical protein
MATTHKPDRCLASTLPLPTTEHHIDVVRGDQLSFEETYFNISTLQSTQAHPNHHDSTTFGAVRSGYIHQYRNEDDRRISSKSFGAVSTGVKQCPTCEQDQDHINQNFFTNFFFLTSRFIAQSETLTCMGSACMLRSMVAEKWSSEGA